MIIQAFITAYGLFVLLLPILQCSDVLIYVFEVSYELFRFIVLVVTSGVELGAHILMAPLQWAWICMRWRLARREIDILEVVNGCRG